jgi:hypothetical protein
VLVGVVGGVLVGAVAPLPDDLVTVTVAVGELVPPDEQAAASAATAASSEQASTRRAA